MSKNKSQSILPTALANFLLITLFAWLLVKGRVFEADIIRKQFTLENHQMMKMFLTAVLSSQLCVWFMMSIHGFDNPKNSTFAGVQFRKAHDSILTKHSKKSFLEALVGCSFLGAGMALCGTCPGTIYAQLGAWVGVTSSAAAISASTSSSSVLFVFLGGLFGLVTHHLLNWLGLLKWIFPSASSTATSSASSTNTTNSSSKSKSKSNCLLCKPADRESFTQWLHWTVPGLMAILVGLEYVQPTQFTAVDGNYWPPQLAGLCIGFLQFVSVYLLAQPISVSTNMVSLMLPLRMLSLLPASAATEFDRLFVMDQPSKEPLFNRLKWYSLLEKFMGVCGGVFGGWLGWLSLNITANTTQQPFIAAYWPFILGGWLILFGSRLAGGCTSGHGITGMGFLVKNSVGGVAAMCASGLLVGMSLSGSASII